MRPLDLLVASTCLACALLSPAVHAADPSGPSDPFAAAPATSADYTAPLPLVDPFAVTPASEPAAEPVEAALADPFAAAPAPACPVRTTESGLVIQRPSAAACPPEVEEVGLRDPFAA
jgi:hypothetical protein